MPVYWFKERFADFIVEEKIPQEWLANWPVTYYFIEKKNRTTEDIINYLVEELGFKRKDIWVVGLKDKVWITRQWFSFYKSDIQKFGWRYVLGDALKRVCRILKSHDGLHQLKIWDNVSNMFFLRLRYNADPKDAESYSKRAAAFLEEAKLKGFDNVFWSQRFWFNGRNFLTWQKLLEESKRIAHPQYNFDQVFKVQAFGSHLFNEYIYKRQARWLFDKFLVGDVVIKRHSKEKDYIIIESEEQAQELAQSNEYVVTWPVFGYDLFTSHNIPNNVPYELEQEVLKENWLSNEDLVYFQKFKINWLRRPIKQYLMDCQYKFKDNDLLIMFELWSGSYASVMVDGLNDSLNDGKEYLVREKAKESRDRVERQKARKAGPQADRREYSDHRRQTVGNDYNRSADDRYENSANRSQFSGDRNQNSERRYSDDNRPQRSDDRYQGTGNRHQATGSREGFHSKSNDNRYERSDRRDSEGRPSNYGNRAWDRKYFKANRQQEAASKWNRTDWRPHKVDYRKRKDMT